MAEDRTLERQATDERIHRAAIFDRTSTSRERKAAGTYVEPSREISIYRRCEVLVVGGGPSGTAAAAAAVKLGYSPAETPVVVTLPGGDLVIRVAADGHEAWMDGPAVEAYRGHLPG